ncbi:TPA: hypothetical protein QDC55_003282 [Burkholderia cenocepacia]|nr:hypothetical protein [Burkholderia cenocepacia]HDR9810202.1 hypothetical protein [Burkholderia cenocepacia]HDR9817972.1 hypothetical protein [Burkholderia cenocepacia]HDR9829717.1 hypothetical protein [Burkholderia cenocepacia]
MSDQMKNEEPWNDEAQAAARARYEAEWQEMVDEAGTPEDSAFDLMDDLEYLWLAVAPGKTAEDFEAEIATPFHDRNDIDVDAMEAEYAQITVNDAWEFASWPLIETPILIAYGHAVLARLANASASADPRARDLAWARTRDASYWHGVAMGLVRVYASGPRPVSISDVARNAAHVRNAENRAIRGSAFEWLDANFADCRSQDDAAERLMKIVPVAFRTARRYVTQWRLSSPSAGRE